MTEKFDWIAVGPYGVYALMDAQFASMDDVSDFRQQAARLGHRTDLVGVSEACRRHHEYLMQFEDMRQAAALIAQHRLPPPNLPSFLPSPAQFDLFPGGWCLASTPTHSPPIRHRESDHEHLSPSP